MDRQTIDRLAREKAAAALLAKALPMMQPSALKHQYLTSVANVLMHPVDTETDPGTGERYLIGFGDFHRSMPLLLIMEPAPDNTVRHAFVPSPNNPRELGLLKKLQEHDAVWARERLAEPRDIVRQIVQRGRTHVNRHGINRFDPSPFTDTDIDESRRWYPTRPIEPNEEILHSGPPAVHNMHHDDYNRISDNLLTSLNMALSRDPKAKSIKVEAKKQTLRVTHIEFEDEAPERDDGLSL